MSEKERMLIAMAYKAELSDDLWLTPDRDLHKLIKFSEFVESYATQKERERCLKIIRDWRAGPDAYTSELLDKIEKD